MKKKVEDMEEKVQTLTAQLLVYKEDFDLERKDREAAHGRIVELEQQLMFQVRRETDLYNDIATEIIKIRNVLKAINYYTHVH